MPTDSGLWIEETGEEGWAKTVGVLRRIKRVGRSNALAVIGLISGIIVCETNIDRVFTKAEFLTTSSLLQRPKKA
jgi:hypothetical protein